VRDGQQLALLDVAVQAGPLAQQPAAQRGVVGDQPDELIEAAEQLGNDRRNMARRGHARDKSSSRASTDKSAAPSPPRPTVSFSPPRPSELRPAARILAAPRSRARSPRTTRTRR